MPRKTPVPRYRKQKQRSGKAVAFIEISGQRKYLPGPYGSEESRAAYGLLVAELQTSGGQLPVPRDEITIVELGARYLEFSKGYYSAGELRSVERMLSILTELYGRSKAAEFGPLALRTLQDVMVTRKLARSYINKLVGKVRRLFRWAVSRELLSPSIVQGLDSVEPLKRGRCEARETEAVKPVPEADIEAVRALVGRQIRALIDLQLHTAARPGELVIMRAVDLDMSGKVWTYKPSTHKNHLEVTRTGYLPGTAGPRRGPAVPFRSPCGCLPVQPARGYGRAPREPTETAKNPDELW